MTLPTKFKPYKSEIVPNRGKGIGAIVRSEDGKNVGRKLDETTGCSSYCGNGSTAKPCRDTCEEAETCPIWNRTRA